MGPQPGPALESVRRRRHGLRSPTMRQFYTPMTPAQYACFSPVMRPTYSLHPGDAWHASEIDQCPACSSCRVADAGLALLGRGRAGQGWSYDAGSGLHEWRYRLSLHLPLSGGGHRSRLAEHRRAALAGAAKMLTADLSGRYDDYTGRRRASFEEGHLQRRPRVPADSSQLLFRGRYGTVLQGAHAVG